MIFLKKAYKILKKEKVLVFFVLALSFKGHNGCGSVGSFPEPQQTLDDIVKINKDPALVSQKLNCNIKTCTGVILFKNRLKRPTRSQCHGEVIKLGNTSIKVIDFIDIYYL